jgi:[ribosomal protein S5]-alanine N-acetyltransferase
MSTGLRLCIAETTRLRLRELDSGDAAFIVELLNDPDFITYVGDRGVRTSEDARRYIASGPGASYLSHGFGLYVVELKTSAVAAGLCGLLRRDTHPDVEIGFALLPRFRRCGYTLEASRAVLRLALGPLRLTRIVALAAPGNVGSIRILEALGLVSERVVNFTGDGRESRLFVLDTTRADTLLSP